jgi:hypothetical protein
MTMMYYLLLLNPLLSDPPLFLNPNLLLNLNLLDLEKDVFGYTNTVDIKERESKFAELMLISDISDSTIWLLLSN